MGSPHEGSIRSHHERTLLPRSYIYLQTISNRQRGTAYHPPPPHHHHHPTPKHYYKRSPLKADPTVSNKRFRQRKGKCLMTFKVGLPVLPRLRLVIRELQQLPSALKAERTKGCSRTSIHTKCFNKCQEFVHDALPCLKVLGCQSLLCARACVCVWGGGGERDVAPW